MRLVFGLVLILGLALAGFAVYMAKGYFSTYQAEAKRLQAIANNIVDTVDVYVVKEKVSYGTKLEQSSVRLVKWPVKSLPEGIFIKPGTKPKGKKYKDQIATDALFPENSDKLRSVLRTMEIGEPVLVMKVTEPGMAAGISSRLTPGMRAFAIKVDATSGVSGFLRPGHHVDVYWTGTPPSENEQRNSRGKITKLIQSNMRLVAIDQSANDDISGANIARTVTVEATPQQVAALAQAQGSGRMSLSLVGVGDESRSQGIKVSQLDLLGIEASEKVVIEKERECTIRTRKGGEMVEIAIPCTN